MQTRDLATMIIMAVVQFIIALLFAQMGTIITGIPGTNFLFTILLAIPIAFSLLIYEGRRWRIFIQLTIYILLAIPTRIGGAPFDPIARVSSVITAFLIDVLANSLYGFFKRREKLMWWSILISGIYWALTPLLKIPVMIVYYNPEAVDRFINVVMMLYPVIIGEAIVGGYIGYMIFKRYMKF